MCHDETMYPEPDRFLPERFLKHEGKEPPFDPVNVIFGFGRRCVSFSPKYLQELTTSSASVLEDTLP